MQKLEKTAQAWALTAWRLGDGEVVYRRTDGSWGLGFADAHVFTVKTEAEAALAEARADARVAAGGGPYLFEVTAEDDGTPVPASVREKIRAKGPTVRTDLGKQGSETRTQKPDSGFRLPASGI